MGESQRHALYGLYRSLYAHFGAQGWWPTTPAGEQRPRYYPNRQPEDLRPEEQWEIVTGALLTQNAAWRNVEQALGNLSAHGLLGLQEIAALELDELAVLLRPSGYYRQKARRLQGLAVYLMERHAGDLAAFLRQPAMSLRRELLTLEGIGPETADSILLYAAGYPFFIIDAYTRRILGRLGLLDPDLNYAALQAIFMERLPCQAALFAEYHALLVRHATSCCKSRPCCQTCLLRAQCRYAAGGT